MPQKGLAPLQQRRLRQEQMTKITRTLQHSVPAEDATEQEANKWAICRVHLSRSREEVEKDFRQLPPMNGFEPGVRRSRRSTWAFREWTFVVWIRVPLGSSAMLKAMRLSSSLAIL